MNLGVPTPSGQGGIDATGPAAAEPVAVASPPPAPTGLAALHAVVTAPAPKPAPPIISPAEARFRVRQARTRAGKWRYRKRCEIPSWTVSLAVHLVVLGALGAATVSPEVRQVVASIDSALVDTRGMAEELTPLYNDPTTASRDEAVGDINATSAGPTSGTSFGLGVGSGPPSATPRVGLAGSVSERTVLPAVKISPNLSPLALMPVAPSRDLGGGGMIAGDVTYETSDIGVALDQVAREILRHLSQHRVTVAWLFDESESMKDDQKAIREKFDRITSELKKHAPTTAEDKKSAESLTHVIAGFGQEMHYEIPRPIADIDRVSRAIDRLRIDDTGTENTLHAIQDVIGRYSGLIKKDHWLLIVLVTDESGDDGAYVEEARQAAVGHRVPIYVIGRQSLFGYPYAHLKYTDPVTKDVYWPAIHRGPEAADVEQLQWDGLHERWDEQPSGFAPFELARLARDTGGVYFLLPSEENMRMRTREKAYSINILKEYIPDYSSRVSYVEKRNKSEFRRTLYQIIQETKGYGLPYRFPIASETMLPKAEEAKQKSTLVLNSLIAIQQRLESLRKLRDRETEKRWQANYDLMLAQIVAYQVKAFEYRACLYEMIKKPPTPKQQPTADIQVEWDIQHSKEPIAPKDQTAKKYLEAEKLLKQVIQNHPRTPWADLAQDELDRGFGIHRAEWVHNAKYDERGKQVPKY